MNINVTKIQRLPNGIIQFYNGSEVVDSFSITSSVSVLFDSNVAKSISFISNVKTLSFNVYNVLSVYGATSNKIYSSGIDPSDTSSAYISRLYDIYAFIISDVIQGCCPGPTFVGGVVATYPDFASFPVTGQESVIYIDESTSTAYFWNGSNYEQLISLSVADKMVTIGRNSTGSTLYKGTVIYINGSTGNRPNFVKAQANSEATSAGTFGIVLDDIPNNSDGYVVTIGTIDNLDTRSTAPNPFTSDTLADGDTIYLSPTTAGYVTNVKPYAPSHLVYVGKVVRTSPTNGVIVYRIQNGYELDELHDVAAQTPSDNDGLFFESATSLWKNKTVATALGYTPVPETRTLTINGTTQDLSANRTFTIATGLTVGTTPITSGTVGRVLFEGTGNVLQESANLFWDATNNNLGIGTTSPNSYYAKKLVIASPDEDGVTILANTVSSTNYIAFADGTAGNQAFRGYLSYKHQTDQLTFGSAGTLRMTLTSGGNLLINTTTDAGYKLDVNGTARVQGNLTLLGTTAIGGGYGVTSGTFNIIQNGPNIVPTSGTMVVNGFAYTGTINQTGGANGITRGLYINPTLTSAADFRAIETTAGNVLFGASGTGFYWDNTNARLGIGTASPAAKASVVSTTALTGLYVENLGSATSPSAVFKNNQNSSYASVDIIGGSLITNSNKFQFGQYSGGDAFFFLVGNNNLDFFTNSVNRIRIFGNGNFAIGTTTDAGYKLDVNGTARVSGTFQSTYLSFRTSDSLTAIYPTNDGFTLAANGNALRFQSNTLSSALYGYNFINSNGTRNWTTGTGGDIFVQSTYAPTSGSGVYNLIALNQTINQTGGANGITRGLYVNATLTSAANFRAIETARGNIVFGNLPTSSAGLPTGALWNDGGTVKIV